MNVLFNFSIVCYKIMIFVSRWMIIAPNYYLGLGMAKTLWPTGTQPNSTCEIIGLGLSFKNQTCSGFGWGAGFCDTHPETQTQTQTCIYHNYKKLGYTHTPLILT